MLTHIHPKLPMRSFEATRAFYVDKLGFTMLGNPIFTEYLMVQKDHIEIHFFLFSHLDPLENDGQVYIRTNDILNLYNRFIAEKIAIHPNGALQLKPWKQWEFSILDPDNNLLTFGEAMT